MEVATVKGINSFGKEERLRHKSLVDGLYRHGKTIYEFPLRATWRSLSREELTANFRDHVPDGIGHLQMMVTVPKKKRKKAVDRVLMRRRIREAYRLHRHELKQLLLNEEDLGTLSLAFVYIHNENLPYSAVAAKMKKLLRRVGEKRPKTPQTHIKAQIED